MEIAVFDKDTMSDDLVGTAELQMEDIAKGFCGNVVLPRKGKQKGEVKEQIVIVKIDWPEIDETSAYSACYTTGTTGKPKGVYYSHRGIYLHSTAMATNLGMTLDDCVMLITRHQPQPAQRMLQLRQPLL